jgi:hypothetical protein
LLRDVYNALADSIRDEINDVYTDIEVEPRPVPNPSEFPCIDIFPGIPSRDGDSAAFGDVSGFEVVTVRVRVSPNDQDEAMDMLIDFNDDTHALSMTAAIEGDQQLDGWATGVWVDGDSFSGILDFSTTAQQMVGCTWRVLIARADT